MSRTIHNLIKRSHFTLALGAAALVGTSGCQLPPGFDLSQLEDPTADIDLSGATAEPEAELAELAALTLSAQGEIEIVILTEAGEVTERIETSYRSEMGPEASEHSLMHHSEGFFLVTSRTENWGALILRVDRDGSVSEFARPAANPMYRIGEAFDGGIVIAAEYELVKLDPNGIEIARDFNTEACWTDVVASSNAYEGPVATDVMGASEAGPVLAVWEIDENNPTTDPQSGVATSAVGENSRRDELLGQDESGALWMAGRSGELSRSDEGEFTDLGRIEQLFDGAFMARAVEPAGEESVYVLIDGGPASQVGTVNADGEAEVLFDYSESLLMDMVVL